MATGHAILRVLLRAAKRLGIFLLVLFILFAVALASGYYWFDRTVLSTLPADLSSFRSYRPTTSCQVFASNGVAIDRFYLERRVWVPIVEIPDVVWQAFIAAEDRRFLIHPGVDLLGITRALWVNLRTRTSRQGGSTITQQLVKNLIVGKERSYLRKVREATLAFRLEQELTKQQILEMYLNYIALGSGNYGVEAAAQDYFGLSARNLDAGQAALLAGLVPAPSRYSPRANPERAALRRELVLLAMTENGDITAEDAARYAVEPVLLPKEARRTQSLAAGYATEVRREVRRLMSAEAAAAEGLKVYTPLDLDVQKVAEEAVRDSVRALEARQGRMGAVRHIPPERWEQFPAHAAGLYRLPTGQLEVPQKGDCFEALVGAESDLGKLRAGEWTFVLDPKERELLVRERKEGESKRPLRLSIEPGDVLRVCVEEKERVRLDPRPWGQGAAVVIENATGRVIALVGGYEVSIEGFVRATQARRQPGSSFKPYVYAAALLSGKQQLDRVLDGPISLPAGGGKRWEPGNYDGHFSGMVSLRRALAQSLNTVAVRLTIQTGVENVIQTARDLGVKSPLRKDLTIALGSSEVTPMDHAIAYSTIARMGIRMEPAYIDRVLDVRDRQVGVRGGDVTLNGERLGRLPGEVGRRVMPSAIAYELADMMRQVVRSGTARSANKPGYDRAGKTGTTNGFVDAWFVGFTPRYTAVVWIGTDGTSTLGDKETGGRAALPAWIRIIEALPHVEGERLPIPDEATLVMHEGEWIGLPRGAVPVALLSRGTVSAGPIPRFEDPLFRSAATSTRTVTSTRSAPRGAPARS